MDQLDDILDAENDHLPFKVEMICTFNDRCRHMVADFIFIGIVSFFLHGAFLEYVPNWFSKYRFPWQSMLIVYFIYYIVLETVFGATLGKYLTRSRVLNDDNAKPSLRQATFRSIIRLIPLEFLSVFTLYQKPLHDILTKTWVVRIKKIKR